MNYPVKYITSFLLASLAALLPLEGQAGAPCGHAAADCSSPDTCSALRPNIVFILMDDMPYAATSVLGNEFLETPAMDRLMKEGMFFSRAYSEILCAPSRASLMTGQWSARHGRTDVVAGVHPKALMKEPELPDPVQPETYTLPKAFQAAGYKTAITGKWHLPWFTFPLDPDRARRYGFNFSHRQFSKKDPYKSTENFTDEAITFIRENKDHPFFLYLPYVTVHGPHIVPKADKERWAKRLEGKNPGWTPDMLASMEFTDRAIARVLATLDELGLAKNTMVVFTSDNGGVSSEVHSVENKPFRLGKGSLYEGGVRVPLFVRWPGRIVPGSRCDTPMHFVDLFPTFCDVANVPVDPQHKLDGVSIKPLFSGGSIPERSIFLHYPHYLGKWGTTPVRAVIQNRYKLVLHPYDHIEIAEVKVSSGKYVAEPQVELFDLQANPGERTNLATQLPEKVSELKKLLEAWLKETGAKDVSLNPAYDSQNPLFNARDDAIKKGEE